MNSKWPISLINRKINNPVIFVAFFPFILFHETVTRVWRRPRVLFAHGLVVLRLEVRRKSRSFLIHTHWHMLLSPQTLVFSHLNCAPPNHAALRAERHNRGPQDKTNQMRWGSVLGLGWASRVWLYFFFFFWFIFHFCGFRLKALACGVMQREQENSEEVTFDYWKMKTSLNPLRLKGDKCVFEQKGLLFCCDETSGLISPGHTPPPPH